MIRKRESQAFLDQQADAMGSVNDFVECADEQCETSERWKHIKESDGWQVSNDTKIPLLCPECADRSSDEKLTPTEQRKKYNQQLTEWSE